jgi:putative heme-binding domain-containing protein
VRYQLAFTAGEIRGPGKLQMLAAILRRDLVNPWVQNAVLSSLTDNGAEFFTQLAATAAFRNEPAGLEFLRRIALMLGLQGNLGQVQQVSGFLAANSLPPNQAFALAGDLGEGLWHTRSSLAMIDSSGALNRVYAQATACAIDASFPEAVRVDAVRLLGLSPYSFAQNGDWLLLLCNPQPFPTLQSAAINALGRYDDPRAITGLLERWRLFSPFLRSQAVSAWLEHDSRVLALLQAVESGRIGAGDLSSTHLNFLRTHRNPAIRERALRLFGPVPWRRPEMIDRFRPALRTPGITERGRQTFLTRCSGCHQVSGAGQAFAPDLSGAGSKGKERLLTAIVQPNMEVVDGYTTAVLQTKQGENVIGIISADELAAVTLAQPGGGKAVWPRINIESIERQDWSLMPEAFELGLSIQDMADVLEFLVNRDR